MFSFKDFKTNIKSRLTLDFLVHVLRDENVPRNVTVVEQFKMSSSEIC